MKILEGKEKEQAEKYMNIAIETAKNATCLRSKCGSIIVKNGIIIGKGYNSPAHELESERRCLNNKDEYHKKVTDKTCCIHAEQRAMFDALRKNPTEIIGSNLYFIRLDQNNKVLKAGQPYCTICSKMALDLGVQEFILWHENGITAYKTDEYNKLSYEYRE